MCEFSHPGRADRHTLMVLRDLAWHGAVSSLSAVYLDDSDAGGTAAIARWLAGWAPTSRSRLAGTGARLEVTPYGKGFLS